MARPKDKEETILSAAISVFQEKGFPNTSIQDIATAAGLAKGTLYEYFKSKDDLFIQALRFQANQIDEDNMVDEIIAQNEFIHKLKLMLDFTLRREEVNHSLLTKAFFKNDIAALKPESRQEFHNFMDGIREKAIGIWADILRQGVLEGVIGNCDVELSAVCIFHLIMIYHPLVDAQQEVDADFKSKLLTFILNGVDYHER